MESKVHLLVTGAKVACQQVPYHSFATLDPTLVTCARCARTRMYGIAFKCHANRKGHRKSTVFQKGLFDNE
jgi:hypothetical protein